MLFKLKKSIFLLNDMKLTANQSTIHSGSISAIQWVNNETRHFKTVTAHKQILQHHFTASPNF